MIFIEILVIFVFPGVAIINAIYNAITGPERERKAKEIMAKQDAEMADIQRRYKENRERAVKEFNEGFRAWLLTSRPSLDQIERFKFQAAILLKLAEIEKHVRDR
jgi:hypothetical protein